MNNYEQIQKHIDAARIQRAVYLSELIANGILSLRNFIRLHFESFQETKVLQRKTIFAID